MCIRMCIQMVVSRDYVRCDIALACMLWTSKSVGSQPSTRFSINSIASACSLLVGAVCIVCYSLCLAIYLQECLMSHYEQKALWLRVGVATRLKIQGPIRPCHPNLIPKKGKVPIVAPEGRRWRRLYSRSACKQNNNQRPQMRKRKGHSGNHFPDYLPRYVSLGGFSNLIQVWGLP